MADCIYLVGELILTMLRQDY